MTTIKNISSQEQILIEGITETTITRYFETLNQGEFAATAALFTIDGELHPPFESAIIGQNAIALYLEKEALNLTLAPQAGIKENLDSEQTKIQVSGQVETPYFKVNVSWQFILNPSQKISYAKVKLLASPQELLKIRF